MDIELITKKSFYLELKTLMWHKKYLPIYDEKLTSEEIKHTNCYAYAFQTYFSVENYELFGTLGFSIGNECRVFGTSNAIEYFKLDVESMGYKIEESDAIEPETGFKVAMFYIVGGDFHFMRLNKGNVWSEKLGYNGDVRKVTDSRGIPILPEKVKFEEYGIKFLGYFWIR